MAPTPKVAVVYYSSTGNVKTLADSIAEGARGAGADVTVFKVRETAPAEAVAGNEAWAANAEATRDVPEFTHDDLRAADAVIFGTPTRYGNISSQLASFIDTLGPLWGAGELADKVYSGFTSSSTLHGGQETTLRALYTSVSHFGGILVTPGYTDAIQFQTGNPHGPSHVDGGQGNPVDDATKASAVFSGKRVAEITGQLLAGRAAG